MEKWELQSYARRLLGPELGGRLQACCRNRIAGRDAVDVWHSPARGSAHYGGLQTCGSVWLCPVCAAKIAERRRELLARAVAACRELGGQVLLASYTCSHRRDDSLKRTLGGFLEAQRWMTGHRPYKAALVSHGVVGAVKALEVTWGTHNGWHPHAHALIFAPSEIAPAALEEELYVAWMGAAFRQGLTMTRERGVRLQATFGAVEEYVAKWGHPPARRPWGAEDELAKGHSKRAHRAELVGSGYSPFDLLRWLAETGERQPAALFKQYAGVFKGRRQLTWSPGLAELLGVADDAGKSDEEIAGEVRDDAILLARLNPAEWRAVRTLDQRGQLLEVARAGDARAVGAFVRELVAEVERRERDALAELAAAAAVAETEREQSAS